MMMAVRTAYEALLALGAFPGGATPAQFCKGTHMSPATASSKLSRLHTMGIILRERVTRGDSVIEYRYRLKPVSSEQATQIRTQRLAAEADRLVAMAD